MLTVRPIEDWAGVNELEPIWNELLSRSGSDGIFLTWEWVSTWIEVYGDDFEPLLLVAEEEGEPCGIAPLMIRRGSNAISRHARTLMFIGQEVDVTPEYLDFIIPRGLEAWVTSAFVRELTGPLADRWDFLSLAQQLASSPNRRHLLAGLGERGVQLGVIHEDEAPYAELPASFEAFLGGKSAGFRKQYKNKANRLRRAGEVRYRLGGEDLPVQAALEEIVKLNRSRWQDEGASFRSQRYLRFHQRLVERLAPRGWVALLLMELDGEIVAGRYDYVYAGKLWCYQGGWSPDHRELNLGDNMLGAILQWGIERGLREYDFLGGAATYKERWATGRRQLQERWGSNRTGRAQLLRLLRQGRDLLGQDLSGSLRAVGRRLLGGEQPRPLQPGAGPQTP